MTSCLLVKAPDRLAAVADGRLSLGPNEKSFETVQKIRRFVPSYRIPRVSMTWFSHFSDFTGPDCCVAFAGTYALVSEVLDAFRERVSGRLILVWRHSVPTLSYEFDEGAQFPDGYEFRPSDMPEITPQLILEEFRGAAQDKIAEFCSLRTKPADCEFLVFGRGPDRRYYAYRIAVDPMWAPGQAVRLDVRPISDGELAVIGSPEVGSAAFDDESLRMGLEGWQVEEDIWSEPGLWDSSDETNAEDLPVAPQDSNWSTDAVVATFQRHILAAGDWSVGGDLTVARGGATGPIAIRSASLAQA